jgi:hypothetical protein
MTTPSPFLVLAARAEARAILYAAAEYDSIEQAIAPLLDAAIDAGLIDELDADTVFAIVRPFAER